MTEYYIAIIVGAIQVVLSISLILRQKKGIANISEILSSLILLCILNEFSIEENTGILRYIIILIEYFSVKIFLVIFMIIARVCSFYIIKQSSKKNKKKKTTKGDLKIIKKIYETKYWPRLKLGLPDMADKTCILTNVKFDSKGFPKFKSYYTVKLRRRDFKRSRPTHAYIANKTLYKNMISNAKLRSKFSRQEIEKISKGQTPNKYTWHHHQNPGVLQLVENKIHSKTTHIGGYSIWGIK